MIKHQQIIPKAQQATSGQALVELLISLVAITALFAAIIQLVSFAMHDHATANAAREEAGELSLSPLTGSSTPDFIDNWYRGPDDRTHSRDDYHTAGNSTAFRQVVVNEGAAQPAEWAILDQSRPHPYRQLRLSTTPENEMGFVSSTRKETVSLLPAVKHLLYDADSIEIENTVWLSTTGDMY